ncbi:hypothetical protein, partial [Erwinia amylovora]|uniref:hypothetical protein n=1 Tax=Erwinia amylovora TaxID=552 RepID=UPI0020C1611F
DGLDLATPIRADRIVNVHGALDRAACEFCGAAMDFSAFCDAVRTNIRDIYAPPGTTGDGPAVSTPIVCTSLRCGKPGVKPATVLYGRSMPP